jgi:hypothetical protein
MKELRIQIKRHDSIPPNLNGLNLHSIFFIGLSDVSLVYALDGNTHRHNSDEVMTS